MKKFLTLFWLLGLLFTLNGGEASTPLVKASSGSCHELISELISSRPLKLEVKSGSLFDYDKSLTARIDELMMPEISLSSFFEEFLKDQKRPPTLREGLQHIISQKNITIDKYEILISDLEKRNLSEHMNLNILINELKKSKEKLAHFKKIPQLEQELRSDFLKGKTHIHDLDEVIRLKDINKYMLTEEHYVFLKNKIALGNFQGEYGELMSLASANEKIISRGLTFKTDSDSGKSYSHDISMIVDKLEERLKTQSESQLVALVKKHGTGLLRHAQEYIDDTYYNIQKHMIIEKIMIMVRSKEIDIVLIDSKGRHVWSEVKSYNETISKKLIRPEGHPGKKNIYDQLIEHKALAEILGLKDVRFRFISPSSVVDQEAQDMISALGYEVVFAK